MVDVVQDSGNAATLHEERSWKLGGRRAWLLLRI